MDIQFIMDSLEETKVSYRSSKKNLLWLEQYRSENQNYRDYEGREILELLQNADDAQSSHVDIHFDSVNHTFSIKNYGEQTLVFTKEGFRSIMASNLSTKVNDSTNQGKFIGAKGLGFKSILNWTSEVCIKSDNVIVRFGEDMVANFWKELRDNIDDPEMYEAKAKRDGHIVPLPILRLPEIDEWKESQARVTIIELTLTSNEIGDKIRKALIDFSPESLLFLHNLRNIRIDIDGEIYEYYINSEKINGSLEKCTINDVIWLVSRHDGQIDGRNFEVAAAFNLNRDHRVDSYNLYTFFPTDEEFPYPCILHATLELNASRKAILTGESINSTMMGLLADRIIDLADELKILTHSWDSYKLISGNFKDKKYSKFASELKTQLEQKSIGKEFIPILYENGYSNIINSYYYDDAFYAFVKEYDGAEFFPRMMLIEVPEGLRCRRDDNAINHIENFADKLKNDELAKFIKIIYDYRSKSAFNQRWNLHLLKDDNGDVIMGMAYLNAGRKIADIPDFLDIKYVNDDLKKYLLSEFKESGTELDQIRNIARHLSDTILNVSQSDVSGIKQMLMLSRTDEAKYNQDQIEKIIACLYNLYLSKTDEFKKIKVECFIPNEDGRLRAPGELIFGDERFPDGFKRLRLKNELYSPSDFVRFPSYLLSQDENSYRTIQEFYTELGVNKYFRTKVVCYGDDRNYLKQNDISEKAIINGSSDRVGNGVNTCSIPIGLENWNVLNLTDLVRLICASDLSREIINNIGLTWYYNRGWFGPEKLRINYISYLLQKETAAGNLKNYVISTKEWLTDPDKNFIYTDNDDIISLVLKRLGAKDSYSNFTPSDLYRLINARAFEFEKTGNANGIPEFYHKVKMAFASMGDNVSLPDNVKLRMMCKLGDKTQIMDSRQIFYSNNWTSKKLESELPILSLQLRDGEDQVNRYFGCRRVKDLAVKIIKRTDNNNLCQELNIHIEKLKPYILALISKDLGDGSSYNNEKKNLMDRLAVSVVKSASYRFEYDDKFTDIENMNDGDLFIIDKVPLICCRLNSLADALLDPQFCNSIAEAICVVLNLSSKENTDRFYRIIKASDRELDFLANNISPNLWQSCLEAFGISDSEIEFWEHVFDYNGKKLDFSPEKIREGKTKYIADCLDIPMDRGNRINFETFHVQKLQKVVNEFVVNYKIWLHDQLSDSIEKQKHYLSKISDFQSDTWIQEAFSQWDQKYAISPSYRDYIIDRMKEIFQFDFKYLNLSSTAVPTKFDIYDYEGIELNIEDESLLYFEGNEDYFANLRDKYNCSDSTADDVVKNYDSLPDDSKEKQQYFEISIVNTDMPAEPKEKIGNKRGRGKTGRKLNDKDLKDIGNIAEDTVKKAFSSPDSNYEIGEIYSKHLNPESGNDAQGYDMTYKRKGESIFRCLEIKNCVGSSIIVSKHEYDVARSKEYRDLYDVALVSGNKIQIWRNAFSDETKYTKSSDDYTITFKINPIDEDS